MQDEAMHYNHHLYQTYIHTITHMRTKHTPHRRTQRSWGGRGGEEVVEFRIGMNKKTKLGKRNN